MANRFTDTQKWEDPWFRNLPSDWKTVWFYLCERCDHAGIWNIDIELLNYLIKPTEPITEELLYTTLNNGKERVKKLENGRIFVCSFVGFQYKGELNEKCSTHRGVIKRLKEHGAWQHLPKGYKRVTKGLKNPSGRVQDKDKDKDICNANKLIDLFNEITGTSYKHSDTARGPILARLKDGYTPDQCLKVIKRKFEQWKDRDDMVKYIRIETLFRPTKFEGYVNELDVKEPKRRML